LHFEDANRVQETSPLDVTLSKLHLPTPSYLIDATIYFNIIVTVRKRKTKLSLYHAVETYRVMKCWGYHILQTIRSQMQVRLSALCTGSVPLPRNIISLLLVFISVRGWVGLMWPEELAKLKNFIRFIGFRTPTFQRVA
jgi:hypothetical protein